MKLQCGPRKLSFQISWQENGNNLKNYSATHKLHRIQGKKTQKYVTSEVFCFEQARLL